MLPVVVEGNASGLIRPASEGLAIVAPASSGRGEVRAPVHVGGYREPRFFLADGDAVHVGTSGSEEERLL
jgi:hypothetical protein